MSYGHDPCDNELRTKLRTSTSPVWLNRVTVTAGGRRFRVGHVRLESTIIISKVYNVQYLYSDESSAKCVTHKR